MPYGGAHPEMATHNHLLRLGDDVFLEVIAVDPTAENPERRRWFGLDDATAIRNAWDDGRRLRGWVVRTHDLDAITARHGGLLGHKTRVSRGDRSWHFLIPADGSLPAAGFAPSVIDWGDRGCPAPAMPNLGAKLLSFSIEHPDPAAIAELYTRLEVVDPPDVRHGAEPRYRARIQTPAGIGELT
jgi:Glyoxalase-like domain